MTRYELIKSVKPERLETLIRARIISDKYKRYVYIYEHFLSLRAKGLKKLDAYMNTGGACFMNEDNVRKVIRYMEEVVK